MGRYPDKRLAGLRVLGLEQRTATPFEEPESGCPGAYYRTPLIDSLWPFMRRRTRDGGRVENPLWRGAHWMILAAVQALEVEEERWHAHVEAEIAKREQKRIEEARKSRAGG